MNEPTAAEAKTAADILTADEWDAAPDTSDMFTHNGVEYYFWCPSAHNGPWVS